MKGVVDGSHLRAVLVTPLQPPFPRGVEIFRFGEDERQLALSAEDAAAVRALVGRNVEGAMMALEQSKDDPEKIRVRVL